MFYVYYRTSKGRKGRREFRTRNAQVSFIINAPMGYAITAYN